MIEHAQRHSPPSSGEQDAFHAGLILVAEAMSDEALDKLYAVHQTYGKYNCGAPARGDVCCVNVLLEERTRRRCTTPVMLLGLAT